jgi:hypothetical protein
MPETVAKVPDGTSPRQSVAVRSRCETGAEMDIRQLQRALRLASLALLAEAVLWGLHLADVS